MVDVTLIELIIWAVPVGALLLSLVFGTWWPALSVTALVVVVGMMAELEPTRRPQDF